MTDINDEFWLRARRDADERKQIDFEDQQNELAGRETGRMKRFLSADARDNRDPKKREQAESERLSRLQRLLMSNPAYAVLYNDTFDKLREIEQAAERALQVLIAARDKAGEALEQTMERAARLPDGTRVFRDAKGTVWTEHGEQVDAEIAETIHWRGDEPAYETFIAQGQSLEKIDKGMDDIRTGQVNILGKFREELEDEENPPTEDRLNDMNQQIEGYQQRIEQELTNFAPAVGAAIDAPAAKSSTMPLPPS